MLKIEYTNLDFLSKKPDVVYINDYGNEENTKDFVLYNFHRFYGNHMEGHGRAKYKAYEVTREPDEQLQEDIIYLEKKIASHQKKIAKLKETLAFVKYEEKYLNEIEVGRLPTDEELLAE